MNGKAQDPRFCTYFTTMNNMITSGIVDDGTLRGFFPLSKTSTNPRLVPSPIRRVKNHPATQNENGGATTSPVQPSFVR